MDDGTSSSNALAEAQAQAQLSRAERYRERFRSTQIIAAQKAPMATMGRNPDEGETVRLVAEFHARGGQVTMCAAADERSESVDVTRSKRR
jgi:hypothetical protein